MILQATHYWTDRLVWVFFSIFWITFFYFSFRVWRFSKTPFRIENSIVLDLKPKATVFHLTSHLLEKDILTNPRLFLVLAYVKNAANNLKTGEYDLEIGMTPSQLLYRLKAGRVKLHRFTIIEGWTYQQLCEALQKDKRFKNTLDSNFLVSLKSQLSYSVSSPEGLLFAESYDFPRNTPNTEILHNAFQMMQEQLLHAWEKRAAGLPWKNPYEALIAASLVEKETALIDERAKIAGVIIRRLQKGMPLQLDVSVIYGLGKGYRGQFSKRDLRSDTSYNIYTRKGLPPTPIAMPSLSSIQAVLNPDLEKPYLYFVLANSRQHTFSENLAEHEAAVARYRKQMRTLP